MAAEMQIRIFALIYIFVTMTDFDYILQQAKKAYYSGWNDVELRKCVDMLPSISRQELVMLYSSRWLSHDKPLKDSIFHLLFDARIEERDMKIKAMSVDELIENLGDDNSYGKFIVLEMKERFDSLDGKNKMKIIDTLSTTTKVNQRWAEGKLKKMDSEK